MRNQSNKIHEFNSLSNLDQEISFSSISDLITNSKFDYFSPHTSNYYSILIITEGTCFYMLDFSLYELKAGDLLVISPNQLQNLKNETGYKGFVLSFTENFVSDYVLTNSNILCSEILFKFLQKSKVSLSEDTFSQIKILINLLNIELHFTKTNTQRIILQNLLSTIIIYMDRDNQNNSSENKADHYISLVLNFKLLISKDFNHSHDVHYYAEKLNVSVRTLQIATKKVLDKAPKDLITDNLILESKRNLMNMNCQIQEVAYRLGFVDASVFSKYFKKHTSFTPVEFRKKIAQ